MATIALRWKITSAVVVLGGLLGLLLPKILGVVVILVGFTALPQMWGRLTDIGHGDSEAAARRDIDRQVG